MSSARRIAFLLPFLLLGLVPSGVAAPPLIASATIGYDKRVWARGSIPTLTIDVTRGRGLPEKVAVFLYYSAEPNAFLTSPWPPQFVGVLTVPSTTSVVTDRPPERGPINEFSSERFVQGALFDPMTGLLEGVTNQEYLDIHYDSPPTSYHMDFETDDDFVTDLANGQALSSPGSFGRLFSLGSRQPPSGAQHFGPAAFDSDPNGPNAGAEDQDLLVDAGNVLILQETGVQTVPGIFDKPDDAANGGTLVFDFTGFGFLEKVEPLSIRLIDIDIGSPAGASVVLIDVLDHRRTFTVPPGWTEDVQRDGQGPQRILDLTTLDPQPGFLVTATAAEDPGYIPGEVVRLEVTLGGSGAVDDLDFQHESDPVAGLESRKLLRR